MSYVSLLQIIISRSRSPLKPDFWNHLQCQVHALQSEDRRQHTTIVFVRHNFSNFVPAWAVLFSPHTEELKDVMTSSGLLFIRFQCHQVYIQTVQSFSGFPSVHPWCCRMQFCYSILNSCLTHHYSIGVCPAKLSTAFPL